jgi:asparagine synthase (glutamine-hydrolysing)
MSGFLGLVDPTASPDEGMDSLRRMATGIVSRSPAGLATWTGEGAALVQGAVRQRAGHLPGPRSLGDGCRIVGDVRLAARTELLNRLRAAGEVVETPADDLLLLLHAYRAWGPDCTRHLLGDFSFAIWDDRRRQLFAARDHLGVKPFFHAAPPGGFVFSNTLDAVRRHPALSLELDERFIGDYLLFTQSYDLENTVYAAVRRLPPGHSLIASAGGEVRLARYWYPPEPSELRLPAGEYVECFRRVLTEAVSDALDGSGAAVMMSGGLDSTMIAAVAARCAGPAEVRGYTIAYESLYLDPERIPAREAADFIGIGQEEHVADPYGIMQDGTGGVAGTPEPTSEPLLAMTRDLYRRMAEHHSVVLTGFDGDAVLGYAFDRHVASRLRALQFGRLAREIAWLASLRPLQPVGLRSAMRRRFRRPAEFAGYPEWISPELERSQGLRARWLEVQRNGQNIQGGRAPAHRQLRHPVFPWLFEYYDAQWTGQPLEFRHPLMDLRVVSFLLSLPSIPWCVNKHVFREAMVGWLPESVRTHVKTPMTVDLTAAMTARDGPAWWTDHDFAPEIDSYVSQKHATLDAARSPGVFWSRLRVVGLSGWLAGNLPLRSAPLPLL